MMNEPCMAKTVQCETLRETIDRINSKVHESIGRTQEIAAMIMGPLPMPSESNVKNEGIVGQVQDLIQDVDVLNAMLDEIGRRL